ncbi:MAG: S8 family serine peptidase, partial [Lewinella sp.]|nr:S8 family serine peptidase [Lewinella sp.]
MKEFKVRSENGELTLRKSDRLVGLKTSGEAAPDEIAAQVIPNLGGFEVVTLHGKGNIDDALDQARAHEKVEVGTHIYFAVGDNRPVVPTGIIYIHFDPEVSAVESQTALDAYALETLERRADNLVIARVTAKSPNPLRTAALLQELSMVASAEPDLDIPLDQYFSLPTDGLLNQQWHLENTGLIADANFPTKPGADARVAAAWRRLNGLGSANIRIAVIDNGFDLNHPDLRGKVISPLDVMTNSNVLPTGSANGTHATPCASVALASSNGSGIVGAAPLAQLVPIHGLTYSRWLTERMFDHCIAARADVISCSWGTIQPEYRPSSLHQAAMRKAALQGRNGRGAVIVFAAGNENANVLNFYATMPEVIAVGASTSNDTHAFYSNRGPELSVVAPSDGGWPILAARASWDPGSGQGNTAYYVDGREPRPKLISI